MKPANLLLTMLCCFVIVKTTAQEFKLGKVSIAELEEKMHPKDSSAPAAILFKKGHAKIVYDQNEGFTTLTEVEVRIKIYNKEGYDWANHKIWYTNTTNNLEKVTFSDAVTYNLVDGKIEKTKLKSEGVFDEKISKFRGQKKITMPNVKEGSVIEFSYAIKSPRVSIREWDFQYSIPVNFSEFTTAIPEYYVFNSRQKGYVFPEVEKTKRQASIFIDSKTRSGGSGWNATKTTFERDKIDYIEENITYTAKNFPAIHEEAYVNNIDNYVSSVQFELSMTKFPNSPVKFLSTDWAAMAKTIYEFEDFGPELNKTGYFENDVNAILAKTKTDEEKIMTLFQFVKSRVKWNNYVGYFCDNGVKKAYSEGTGNIGDINLMLTAMLRYAGLTANPVLVSTRSNGVPFFPNYNSFNYVIAAVETANGYVLLDASDKFSSPNILPFRVLNWTGRLVRKDGSSTDINLMPQKASNDIVFMNYSIAPDGKVSGKAKRQCTDYNALITRGKFDGLKEEAYLEKLENDHNKIEISNYERSNKNEILLPVSESYSFTGTNFCDIIGDKIYLNPMLFFTNSKNPFKQEIREYPVDFGFPFMDKYAITIQIPDNYVVESLPKNLVLNMENNLGTFKFSSGVNGKSLQLNISHQINLPIVNTGEYEMLKSYYKTMIEKETEKIVLKKV